MTVSARDARDGADACDGARRAVRFFEGLGIVATRPATLEVVESLPPGVRPAAVGCFLESRRRAFILSYAAFRKRATWFRTPVSRTLYRGVAAHETAHAITAGAFGIPTPSLAAKEYLAYVAMLASMPATLRARVLARYRGRGFESETEINALYYLFDPERFGVDAYRHYARPENGPAFVQAVLRGAVLASD